MKILILTLAILFSLFLTTLQFTDSQYLPKQYIIATNKARKVARVPLVKWNVTLAVYAGRVAKGCGRRPRIQKYGLNIFVGSINITATGCVGTWAGQSRCYNPKTRRCRRHCKCRSYRRMISRRVRYMGCARQTCSYKKECIVCAYWPHRRYVKGSDAEFDGEEFSEEALFYDEEEKYLSGDNVEEEYSSEFNGAEEAENDVDEEYLKEAEELELSGAEEADDDAEEQISGEKLEGEEAMEKESSSGVASKLGAYWLWG